MLVKMNCANGGGVSVGDLLWSNTSPSSTFNSQTVALDLTSYGWVVIETRYGTSGANKSMVLIEKGTVDSTDEKLSRGYASTAQRIATVTDTGVAFDNGILNGNTNNSYAIPTRIWGIKDLTLNQS